MSWNPLTWLTGASSGDVENTIATDAAAAPRKATSLLHAMLESIEEREAGHPLIARTVTWVDELLTKYGQPLITSMEVKALSYLSLAYPALAPEASKIVLALSATAATPAPAVTPPTAIATPPAASQLAKATFSVPATK